MAKALGTHLVPYRTVNINVYFSVAYALSRESKKFLGIVRFGGCQEGSAAGNIYAEGNDGGEAGSGWFMRASENDEG